LWPSIGLKRSSEALNSPPESPTGFLEAFSDHPEDLCVIQRLMAIQRPQIAFYGELGASRWLLGASELPIGA